MVSKRRRLQLRPRYKLPKDACPKCKTSFEDGKLAIVWHDVLECLYCGHIWVAIDYDEALKWL